MGYLRSCCRFSVLAVLAGGIISPCWTVDSGGTADGCLWRGSLEPGLQSTQTRHNNRGRDYIVTMPAYKCRHCRDGAIVPSIVVEESADPGPSLEERVIQFHTLRIH